VRGEGLEEVPNRGTSRGGRHQGLDHQGGDHNKGKTSGLGT
jgi:hypothetical protein